MKILVIEDDDQFRRIVAKMLSAEGHEIIGAADGLRGMELFREQHPDLVITDIIMPTREGMETIIELRRHSPTIKIIAMSGSFAPGDSLDVLKMAKLIGADEIIGKPFRAEELRKLVGQVSLSPWTAEPPASVIIL
jgi:DNA-binding response OmpR family regulator